LWSELEVRRALKVVGGGAERCLRRLVEVGMSLERGKVNIRDKPITNSKREQNEAAGMMVEGEGMSRAVQVRGP